MSAKAPDPQPAGHWAAAVEHPRRGLARLRHGATFAAARDFEAGIYLQDLLVAAVVAILLTRLFLGLTGFPRMGGGGLHVAHMLWGGLLMLIALVLLLAVIGKRTKRLAAVIGGGWIDDHPSLRSWFDYEGPELALMVIVYGFAAVELRVAPAAGGRVLLRVFEHELNAVLRARR